MNELNIIINSLTNYDIHTCRIFPDLARGSYCIIMEYGMEVQQQIFCSSILYGHLPSTSMTNPSFKILSCEEVVERGSVISLKDS